MTRPAVDVRPAASRLHTRLDWLDSRHSFSFGGHYDPTNTHHGVLLVSNDDRVVAGGGFGEHGHRDMEIVTWVLSGSLRHRDSLGTDGVIYPGLAQRMSAGRGIRHSEMNASATEGVHFVQMWVPPGRAGIDPGYEQQDVSAELAQGGLVPVAAGPGGADAAIHLDTPDTTLWVARLDAGASVTVPDAPFVHVFVALGAAVLDGDDGTGLDEGDAARLTAAGARTLTACAPQTEVLVWEMAHELT